MSMKLSLTSMLLLALTQAGLAFEQPKAAEPPLPPEHAANMAASRELFKQKVRPFFKANCLECHGDGKIKAGFSLASRETLLKGGDKGPAILLGKGRTSPLVRYVAHEDEAFMPPKKPAFKDMVEVLAKWIDLGAAYDKPLIEGVVVGKKPMTVTDKDRQYWAYRPFGEVRMPSTRDAEWSKHPIDAFVGARLEEKGVAPAPVADRRTLVRRAYFDLIGLPPTPAEVRAFVDDTSPNAYEKLIDHLMTLPQYGERWARHWMDPARYAESHGFEHDYFRPNAYHYRDFLIKAINANMPYKQFVEWQIAGDELAPNDPLALMATGFLGAGVFPTQITNSEAERIRYDAMDDMLSTTGHAMLGLTVGCARCHDHKYDPIPVKDYYRLLSAFTTTVRTEVEVDLGTPEQKAASKAFEAKLKPLTEELKKYEETELPKSFAAWIAEQKTKKAALPKIADAKQAKNLQALVDGAQTLEKLPKPERDALLKWFAPQDGSFKKQTAAIAELNKQRPASTMARIQACSEGLPPMRHHTADGSIPDFYKDTFYLSRGDVAQKNGTADLGFLQVLSRSADGEKHWIQPKPKDSRSSFKRAGLAKWMTDTDAGAGALAARVMVNRVWHHHFGRGIVSTVNDFGFQGDPPTHPELLEWLARDFVSHGWDVKRLHKQVMTSLTYQLAGAPTASGKQLDPDNRLWHYRPKRRMEAETIRDNLLAISGTLDKTMYGPGTLDQGMKRRSIYFTVQRSQMIPMLQVFDWPDTLTSASARPTTVVAPQALLFLNNPNVRTMSRAFGTRLANAGTPEATVRLAYETAYGRTPTNDETADGLAYLKAAGAANPANALADYALVLMSLNEFIYVD